jgi:isopentenyl-diphosphate delta-isomerase
MTKIIVVDEKDNVLGSKERELVDKEKLRYRVSALWIKNSKNETLLARRAFTKSHDPGKWGPAVAGTVEEGETYESNILKEAEEELGIKGIEIKKAQKTRRDGKHNYFVQRFTSIVDLPINKFKIQKSEVAEVKWFSREEIEKQLKAHPEEFLDSIKTNIKLFY